MVSTRSENALHEARGDSGRDTLMVLGGPSAGKTVWICRLLDALRVPTTLVGGRIPSGETHESTPNAHMLRCEPTSDDTRRRIATTITGLERKSWPLPTADAVEYEVDFTLSGETIRTPHRRLTIVDLPGSALLAAFSPSNPSTLTIGWTVGNQLVRTAAVIVVIDPETVVERSQQSQDLLNVTVAMLEHLRASPDGRSIPIAIVLSKCDRGYKVVMREGGVRNFMQRHLGPVLVAAESARVYASSATRSRLVSAGYREPSTRRPTENLIEPIHFILGTLDRIDSIRRQTRRLPQSSKLPQDLSRDLPRREARIPPLAWTVFALGMLVLAGTAVDFALRRPSTEGSHATTKSEPTPEVAQ